MIFFTYNDAPSGIYKSQVIDVVKYLNSIQAKEEVRLLSFISLRKFSKNKAVIKAELPDSIVIPMIPGVRRWKSNYIILWFFITFSGHKKLICRGPFAAFLGLKLKNSGKIENLVFDARGAYTAELNEYNVVPDPAIKEEIHEIEKKVVLRSDFRLAVSNALVNYWKEKFSYSDNRHEVIPCTLNKEFEFDFPPEQEIKNLRLNLGYSEKDILFVYSGSAAGWQSFGLIDVFISNLMSEHSDVKLLVLSSHFGDEYEVMKNHRDRVIVKWVPPKDVRTLLLAADYGILYREDSITNRVASPVKFAEYLSCGLKVLISENLGDYSAFSKKNNLMYNSPQRVSYEDKRRIHAVCMTNFLKENFKNSYLNILNFQTP